MAEAEEQGGGGGATDPRMSAINDYTLKTLKVCSVYVSAFIYQSLTRELWCEKPLIKRTFH